MTQVAHCKLACHWLDPYQCAAFHCSIVHHNTGEEEADPTLELAMEYAGALGTITTAQQEQVTALRARVVQVEERMDTMREMILALEHTQENPIVVDDEETG